MLSQAESGYQLGKEAAWELGAYAFLLGTIRVLYEIGTILYTILSTGLDAVKVVNDMPEEGLNMIAYIIRLAFSAAASVLTDFTSNNPILTMVFVLLLIVIVLSIILLSETFLIFLTAYIAMSFYTFQLSVNWNILVDTYSASQYPLGPFIYVLIPPLVITCYAYQLANHKTESNSIFSSILNGTSVTIGYTGLVLATFLIFVVMPKGLVTVTPGWEWFIRFNRSVPIVFLVIGIVYPVIFGTIGGAIAAAFSDLMPEYNFEDEAGLLLPLLLRDAVSSISS